MHLTRAERLFIHRRRADLTQQERARALGVPVSRYVRWENGEDTPEVEATGGLKDNERCVIMRRRAGTTQAQVAEELGVCRRWVQMMELGRAPCDDLIWYWEQ